MEGSLEKEKFFKLQPKKLRPLFDKIYDLNRKYLVNLNMDLTQGDENSVTTKYAKGPFK